MKKLLTLILILCTATLFAEMRGGALYDPGAARSNLSNVDATATPSMTSITLSDKVRAAWADILGDIYASGTVKVATGTAAAPAYSFSSDPNTGIYSPGADTLVLATDGANRVRVWPNGHVTINSETDDTSSSLQSYGAVPQTNFNTGISTSIYENPALSLRSQADGRPVTLQFSDSVNSAYYISHKEENLYFGDGFLNTDMVITSSGNLLIGTTTDDGGANKLQVNGSMRLIGGAAPTAVEGAIYFNSTDKHFYGYNGTAWVQLDN